MFSPWRSKASHGEAILLSLNTVGVLFLMCAGPEVARLHTANRLRVTLLLKALEKTSVASHLIYVLLIVLYVGGN